MKKIISVVAFLACVVLLANPLPLKCLSEVWFDDEGDLHLELGSNSLYESYSGYPIRISDGTSYTEFPTGLIIPVYPGVWLENLSELCPGLSFNPQEGTLLIQGWSEGDIYVTMESLNWDQDYHLHDGQSFVQVQDLIFHGFSGYFWAKDANPTPGSCSYSPVARTPLSIHCVDQNGEPVSGVNIYRYPNGISMGATEENGVYEAQILSRITEISARHPQTNELFYQEMHYLEPNQALNIELSLVLTANDDQSLPLAPIKGLEAFPNPYIAKFHDKITLRFEGDQKVLSGSKVIVYNLRGQEVATIEMQPDEERNWSPEPDLPSGTYLLKLMNGKRDLGRQMLRIIR